MSLSQGLGPQSGACEQQTSCAGLKAALEQVWKLGGSPAEGCAAAMKGCWYAYRRLLVPDSACPLHARFDAR